MDDFSPERLVEVFDRHGGPHRAELVYVLESFYELPRPRVAELVRATLAQENVVVEDERILLSTLTVYEEARLHFAEAYPVARAESAGDGAVAGDF